MKSSGWLFFEFVKRFGFRQGSKLFLKFKRNDLVALEIPGIRKPVCLRKATTDIQTFYQVFLENEYEIDWGIEPEVIVDCGAHIGLFAVIMRNKFPDARIICVEPDKENFKCLIANTVGYENIFCENWGVWSHQTKLQVTDKYSLGNWAMVAKEDPENGLIDAFSIDQLMQKYKIDKIDILKLDIESSEKVVFNGDYSKWLPKTKVISIELHDWMVEGCSKPFFEAINESFKSYGYITGAENTTIINNDLISPG